MAEEKDRALDLFGDESVLEPVGFEEEVEEEVEPLSPTEGEGVGSSGDTIQEALFDLDELAWWQEHWVGMPEFVQEDLAPWQTVYVHFTCRADRDEFARLVEQKITDDGKRTRSIWFPEATIGRMMNKRFIDEEST